MSKRRARPKRASKARREKRQKYRVRSADITKLGGGRTDLVELPAESTAAFSVDSFDAQVFKMSDPRLQTAQRQASAVQIGQVQGNRYLQKVATSMMLTRGIVTDHKLSQKALTAPARLGVLQRQDSFLDASTENMSRADASSDPARLSRLDELHRKIETETANSIQLRHKLDALQESSVERAMLEDALNGNRETLINLLRKRIELLDKEIASLNTRIGPNPVSSPDRPGAEALGHELLRREQERRQHEQQLRPLERWQIRRQIGSINEQIAAIDKELATLPQTCDPANPTAELLLGRRTELEQRKQRLVGQLTSTATEYEQWDPRWGSKRYGTSPECTNIKQAGCGPTSLAIVLNYLYQEDPESLAASGDVEIVTPVETARYAETHGRVCNSGTAGDTMVTNVHTGWPGFRGRKITLDQATAELRNGNLVIFLCKGCTGKNRSGGNKSYGGHFMVLNGVNEGDTVYNVLDPGAKESTDILTISHTELQSHTNGFWIIERI